MDLRRRQLQQLRKVFGIKDTWDYLLQDLNSIFESLEKDEVNKSWRQRKYFTFYINKKTKERTFSKPEAQKWEKKREIQAPNQIIKEFSKNINDVIQDRLIIPREIQGFIKGRSILTNAYAHRGYELGYKYTFNLDLENAFHQVNRNNVYQIARYFLKLNKKRSNTLAEMITYNDKMVQGNPLSPLILAITTGLIIKDYRKHILLKNSVLTIYADDITLTCETYAQFNILKRIIKNRDFRINAKKTNKTTRKTLNIPRKGKRTISEPIITGAKVLVEYIVKDRELKRSLAIKYNVNGLKKKCRASRWQLGLSKEVILRDLVKSKYRFDIDFYKKCCRALGLEVAYTYNFLYAAKLQMYKDLKKTTKKVSPISTRKLTFAIT